MHSAGKKRLPLMIAAAVLAFCADVGAVRHANGALLEARMRLDTVAIGEDGGASIDPAFYGARVEALPGSAPTFRLPGDEGFREGTGPFGRFMIPASRVSGLDPIEVDVRYRNILGELRTRRLTVDVCGALSQARTLFLFEGQTWARVVEAPGGGVDLLFDEGSDRVATVRYTLEGGPADVLLAPGETRVHLPARPPSFTITMRTCDGKVYRNRVSGHGASLEKASG